MRRLGPVLAAFVVLVVLAGGACSTGDDDGPAPATASSTTTTAATRPAGPEAVELSVVPLPAEVEGARFAIWSAEGERIVFNGHVPDAEGDQVLSMAVDGTELRCLSCGAEVAAGLDPAAPRLKPIPFADGRRILVRVGEQSPLRAADHGVLECAPSVDECTSAHLVPIVPPAADDPGVVQDQRELRVARDGETVGLSQVRRRADGDSALVAIVGRLQREGGDGPEARYEVAGARVASDLGELKGFTPDGAAALVAGFTTLRDRAANPDVIRVDLTTGEVTDVTRADGYDEDLDLAPDQQSYVVASGRGSGMFETVSQLHRPNFIGRGLEPLTAYLFAQHRADLLEPWLVPVGAEANGELGQPLNPDAEAEGYDGRTLVRWHPEGDRIIWWEGAGDPFSPPAGGATRFVIARLTDREPVPPEAPERSPVPDWAPLLAGYVPASWEPAESRAGTVSGRVEVIEETDGDQTTITVTYHDFAEEAGWVIDGVEAASFDAGLLGSTHYTADLTLSGGHHGWLRADATLSAAGIDGEITSSVDGHALRLPAGDAGVATSPTSLLGGHEGAQGGEAAAGDGQVEADGALHLEAHRCLIAHHAGQ